MLVDEVLRNLQILKNKKFKQVELARVFYPKKEDEQKARAFINNRLKREQDFENGELQIIANKYNVTLADLINPDPIIELDRIYDKPSCGKGTELMVEPYIEPFRISRNSISSYLRCSAPENLKIFQAQGDSMEDTIKDGDFLLVDIGRTDVSVSGVFIFTVNNDKLRCKRLNLTTQNVLEIISDNKDKYDKEVISPTDHIEFKIIGRVLNNLNKTL